MGYGFDGEDHEGDLADIYFEEQKVMREAHISLIYPSDYNKGQIHPKNNKNLSTGQIRNQKGFLIICDSPYDGHTIYYQDRKKSKKGFWTNYKDNALVFHDRILADQTAAKLHYNNPRIITTTI